jgi:23S rRNA-/tRNA-specific pseudouridylate synthase
MVAGDKIYRTSPTGHPFNDTPADLPSPPRQVLHAATLSFTHPVTQKPVHYEMPLPKDLARWVASIEKNAASSRRHPTQS